MPGETLIVKPQWHITTWLIVSLAVLNLFDFGTTYYLIECRSLEEGNSFIAYLIELVGTNWVILWFKVLVLGFLFGMYGFIKDFREMCQTPTFVKTFGVITIAYTVVVISNFSIIFRNVSLLPF